jgi:group I intron endonuclease
MKSGIYKIICSENGKIYIGSSQYIETRIKRHFSQLKHSSHINRHLQSAYDKYGEKSFSYEIVEECSIEDLLLREQYWMDITECYDRVNGFNNTTKADRPLGYKHTDEAKRKMSEAKKGLSLSVEHVEKIKKANTGKKRSEEFKNKLSELRKGEKNPRWGFKESNESKKSRMKNMLETPRWNKGLTIADDPRLKKLANRAGQRPPNALECVLINIETNERWEGDSLKSLADSAPISISTINRLRANTASRRIKETYKLKINEIGTH